MKQELSTVAIDLAKKVLHLVGADTTGKMLWRKRLTRNAWRSIYHKQIPRNSRRGDVPNELIADSDSSPICKSIDE